MADINVDLGDIRGLRGERGSLWYTGTAITHTTGSATPATGIDGARARDMYLNTSTSNVYECTTGGDSGVAVWKFLENIRGSGSPVDTTIDMSGVNSDVKNAVHVHANACHARGDVVAIRLELDEGTFQAGHLTETDFLFGTIPLGCRPKEHQFATIYYKVNGAHYIGLIRLNPDGRITALFSPVAEGVVSNVMLGTSFMRA